MLLIKLLNSCPRATLVSKIQNCVGGKFHTFAPLCGAAHEKHPIQKFGSDYIDKQIESGRPMSPHLQIYKPQWTWYVSGAHRMTGVAMGTVVTVFAVGMMVLPYDFSQVIHFFHMLNMPAPITYALKFIIVFPIVFHALNGIRFLGYDLGYGMPLKTIYKTAYGVVGLSVILSLILAYWKKSDEK